MHHMRGGSVSHSWWESYFSAVNSRWLQENLQNMDSKVKSMMKLIGEDAVDSFGRKRLELVSLVEEFHGAYCALAERYDGLAGEVRKNIPGVLKEEEEALPETIAIDKAEVPPRRILGGRTTVRRQLRRSPKVDPDEIPHPESHRKEKNNKSTSSSSSDSSSSDSDSHHSRGRNIDKSKLEIMRGSLEGLPNRLVYEVEENALVRSDMEVLQEKLEGLEKSSEERCRRYEDELLHSNGKLAALKDEKLSLERVKTELELKVLDLSAVCTTLKGETTQLREEAKDLRIKMQENEREKVQEHLILQQKHQSKCKQLEEEVAHHRDEHKKMSTNSSMQMNALEKERASLTTLVAELDAQAKFYLENCSRLEGEMASSKEAVDNLRRSLQESEMKKMELASLEERSKERCGHLEQEVVYLRDENEKLITNSRTQLQILEEEKASLNRIIEEATMLRKEEHANLTAQIQSLKEEEVSLSAMVNEMKDQVKSWSGKYSILEEETLVLKGENDELRENLLQNDREHSTQLQSLSQRGEDRCRKLEEEIQYHIDELGKVRVNSSAELQSVLEEKASLSRVNTELDDRIKLFSKECSDLKEEVLKMKHENAELRGRFGEVEAEKGRAESEVGTLQQLLSSVGHEHKARCHELQQEISNLKEVSQMKASQLHITQNLVKGLEEEKSLITLERNRLHEEIDYLRVQVVDWKNNLEETVKQKQELELEMDELRQVNIRAQEDTSRLKELCDVHERKTHEVEEKVSIQKMELSELREAIATKVEEVSALQEDTGKLHAMLENVKQEKTGISVLLDNANMMLKTIEERCNQLQDQISSLEEEKLQLSNEKSMIHTHSRGLEEAGFTLQKGKELLESELASWKQKAEEMQAEIDDLRIEEGSIRVKLQILAEKDERAQLATQSLQQEVEAAQANCKMTAEQCHQYAEECSIEKEKVRLSEEEILFQRVRISELQEEGYLKDGKVIALQGSLSEMEELFSSSEKKLQEQSLENQRYLAAVMIQKEEQEKLRVQMQALEEEKTSLNAMVTEIKAQVKSWSGKHSILEEETLVLKGEKEELKEKLLQNDREHTQLLSLSQKGEDRCRRLEEEIQYHIDELEKVRVNSSEQLQSVMEEKASLSRVNIELNDRIKLLSEECSNLKEDVLEMKHDSEALRGRFRDVEAEKGRAESEVGTLQQLLSSVGHEHEARCHELQQEILNLKEACYTTAAELDSTHHLVKNLEEEKSSLTLETNRLCEEVGSLRNSFEEQTKQKQSLELEMEELKQVNIKAQEDILRLKELCDVHERRTREVEEKVSMQQMELSKLGEAISSKVEEVSTLQEEIKKLQKILENVKEEKSLLSVEVDNMSTMLKTTEEKCNHLHNQLSSLEEEKLQLSNEKLMIHTHSRGLEEAGFTLQKGKELLESELASWKQKAEELQGEIDELRIEEGTIREKLQISVEKEESVQLAMKSLQQDLEAAQSNYRNTAEECSTEKEKVRLSDEEILFQRVRISELQEERSLKDGKVIALQGSLSKMEELFASSEKKLQEQSLEYQKCMAAVMIQKEEQEKIRQALEEEKALLDTMLIETKNQVKSLSGKYSILEEETLMLKGENEKLREKLLQNDREHAQLLSLKQRDEDRCRKLEEEIQYHIDELGKVRVDSSAQFQAVMEEKASLSRVNVELDDRIKIFSEECSNLKEEVLKMKHESAELGGRFQEVEAEKRRVESEVGTLQQLLSLAGHEHKLRCHELQQEISDLTEIGRMTEGQLHSTQHLVKSLEEEKSVMTLERNRLHEETDNLRVEVGSLQNSLVEQTNQKQALELQMDELKQVNTRAEEVVLRLKELCDVHERKTCEVEEKVSMQKMELSKLVESISSKVEEVSTLKEETKNLKSILENVKKENTGLSVELANASMMLKTTEERCEQLQDQISALEEEKVQLSNEKSVIHTHSRGLEESRFALQKGKEELESELDLWKQRTEGAQGEISEMKIEISKLTEVSQMTATQLHSTQQLVKSLEEEKSSLTLERSRLHEEVDNLSVELGRLQNSLEEQMKQKQELELKMNELEQVNIKAQEDTLRLKELCDVYEKQTCEGEEKVSMQQMELSILGEAVASKVEEVSLLQEEIRKLQSILENVRKEKTDLSVELDSASMMLKTKEERCNQLQDRVSSLEEEKVQLSNAKSIIDTHLTRVEEAGFILQKGKEALESELASWKKRADEMQAEINESRMEISKLEEIRQLTETQLYSTQDLVKNLEEEKSSATLERSRLHEEVDHLRLELGSLQNSLDEQTKQKQELELEMDELKQVNIMAQEDILRLKESCDVHERKIHQEEEKVSMKHVELFKLGEAIASKVEEVSALQEETRKLQAMLENVKKEKTSLSLELDDVSMLLKTTEERCNRQQDQVSSLEEEKVQLSNEKLIIHTHSRGLEEASFTLQKGKELLESEMASWKQKAEEMQAEINESRIEILKLTDVSQQLHSTQNLVKHLEEEKSSLTLEGSRLHEEVDHLRVEVGTLQNSLEERTKQKQAFKLEMDELKMVNIRAQEDTLKLKELCAVHERKTQEVEEKVSMQQMELSKLGEAIAFKVEEISTLQGEIGKLQSMLENIKKEKTGLSVELDNASMMMKTTEERCNQLQDQVSSLEEEKVQLLNEKVTIHTHSRGLEEAGFILQKGKEALESELASWKQRAEGMQAEINESRIEISKLTEASQMAETQLRSAQDLIKILEEEKSSLTLERSRLHEEVDHLRVELGRLWNSLHEQSKLKQALDLEMDELKQVNIMAQEDILGLKEACDVHARKTLEGEKKMSVQQMEVSKLGKAIASKVEEISTLQEEIRKLQAMIENIKTEKTGLSVELANVSMILKTTGEKCNQLQDQVFSLEEEKVQLSNEKSIIHTHSRGLEEVSFTLQKGKELLESELASWKQRAEEMQAEINESRREISNLTEVSQMTATQLNNTQHLVKHLEEEKSSLTLERSGLCEEVDNLRVEVGSLQNSLEERTKQKQALELEMDELEQVNSRAQEDTLKLEELCDAHERKTREVEEKVSVQQMELLELGEEITSKVEEISTLKNEIRKLQSMLENVEKDKTGLSVELDNVSMMLKTTEERCNQLQDQFSSLEEEKVQLLNEKLTIHTHSRGLEEAGFILQKGKEALESELVSWKQRAEGMQAEINESRIEISKLTEVSQMTETQLCSTQDLVKNLEEEKSSLTLEKSRLHEEVDHLRVELGSLRNSLEEQTKHKQALDLEMDELKQVNVIAQEDIWRLKELCDVHEMKIHKEEEKVSMKQMELSKLGEAIESKVEEISTLQKEIRKLQEMLENITTEKTGLSAELDNVSMMLKTTEERCNQLQDQVSSLEEEKVQLSNEKSIIHTHSRGLEEVSFSLQKGKELLESELASWKQRTEEMQAEINECRREISNLTEFGEMSATQLHNTQHLVKKLEEEKLSLTLERSGLCVEVDDLRVEVGSLQNSLEDQSKQKQALELEMDVLEQVNVRAQEETLKLKELCDVHEMKTREVEKKASMQQMEHSKLGEAIASQVEEISTLQEENKKLQSMLENVEKEKTGMSVDLDNVSMMLKTTEERCNQLQEGKEFLESELASSKQRAERMQGEINELRIEISKLTEVSQMTEAQLHSTQDLVKNLEEEKSSLTLERSRLHEEVDNLRVEVGTLQNSLEELVKQKQALELEMDELEQVNIRAGEDTSRLKELCDVHERKTCEVAEKVYMQQMELSKLGGAIASKVEEVSTLQEEIRKLQSLLENFKEEKTRLSVELGNAGTVLKATEDRCHQLHDQISCLEEEKLQLSNEKLIIHTHSRGLEESRFTLQKGKEELERELALWKQRAEEVQGKLKERLKLSAEKEEKSQLMMQSLQKELDTAQASYMMTVEECSAEREKAKALEALISELQQEGSLQNGKIAALHVNMAKMEELLALSESKIQEQSLELQKYLAESSSAQEIANLLKTQIENWQQQALIASEKLGMLEQEKLLLDEEQRGLHEEITRLRDSLRNLTEEQSSLQSDNQNLRENVSDQGEKIHRLQEQLDGKTQSSLLQENNLKLKFRALQKALINIKQEDRDSREISEVVPREATIDVKETMEEELERLEELLTISNEGSKKLKSEYGDILERCMALQEDIAKFEIFISSLKQENSVQADQISTVLAQNHTLQESKAFLEKEAVQKDVHIKKLKEELSQMQEEGEQAREELQSATGKGSLLEKENQKFCQALSLADDEIKDYKVRGSVLEEKIEMLQKLYSSLETEHGELKHESKRGLDESVFLDKRLREVQDELSLQKDESARLKVEISDSLEKIEALTAENKRLWQEKEACTIEIVSGVKRIEELQEEMSNLRGEIAKKMQEEDEKIRSFQTLSKQYEEDKKVFERGVQAYAELNAMHSIATEKLQSLEENNALLAKQVALSTTRIKVLETEAEELLTEKATTDDKLASKSDHASKLEEQVSTTQPLLARLNQEIDERNVQIQNLQESLKKANQILVDARQKEAQEMINLQGKLEAVVNELNTGLVDENVEIKPQLLGIEEEKMKLVDVASFRTACLEETKRMVSTMKEEPVAVKSESSKTKEILQTATGESHLVEGDIHLSLQEMFAKLESNANNMQSSLKNLEDKNGELWQKLSNMHDENGRLLQEISAKTSQIKKMEQTMATMKEERVIIEAEVGFRIHQVNQAQEEVSRLKQEQKTANSDYEAMTKRLQSVEDEVCTLQTQNQHLGQEVAELMKAEKHFSIALRFTRAEASHLVEKTKMLREEIGKKDIRIKGLEATLYDKDQQASQKLDEEKANLKVELVKVNQEVALLKEESKRQIAIIHDRSEEKREAIRQLCFSIDLLQEKNRNLGRVFDDVREKLKVRGTHVTDR